MLQFVHFQYTGADAEKFLQGQVTVDIPKLDATHYQTTAICDLKGRIHFGIWLKRHTAEHIDIVISQDLADEFAAHIKKFGAFSKASLSQAENIYLADDAGQASFSLDEKQSISSFEWQKLAIEQGQAWINHATAHLFQPQELRLHQRGGIDYDKGCYLGQEIVARLWFKAQPKHWLHLVQGQGATPNAAQQLSKDVQVVNSLALDENTWIALVTAKPSGLDELDLTVLALPDALSGDVARPK